jgi:hypothetical protein
MKLWFEGENVNAPIGPVGVPGDVTAGFHGRAGWRGKWS